MRLSQARTVFSLLLLVSAISISCGKGSSTSNATTKIDLVPVTVEEWRAELSQRTGSITVVDMWATWCYPCLERFPNMVELQRKYAPHGVEFISLSLDDPTDRDAIREARRFLEAQDARFDHYRISENLFSAFEKLGLQGIPAVFIYDASGEQRYKLTGDDPNAQFTDRDVEEAILNLLSAGEQTRS